MEWIKWIVGLIGHLGLWCVAFNRIHATAWPRSSRKFSEKIIFLIVVIPVVFVVTLLISWEKMGVSPDFMEVLQASKKFTFDLPGFLYLYVCILLGIYFIIRWVWRKLNYRLPLAVVGNKRQFADLKSEIGKPLLHGLLARTLGALPHNEILQLTTQEMTFLLDVSPKLDGLRICQLSDLHFTGQIDIEYFERIIEKANEFRPDLIFITGDIVDNRNCLPWLDATLGKLRSTHGVYYVLGNHDRRIKREDIYRGRLESLGLIRAAGRWRSVKYNGAEIWITGNELPWYKGAESLPLDPGSKEPVFKVLLSHSPDQIDWARPYQFDLMFAGHTHGGQIAFPFIGPIVAPSKYGVLYAAGTFQIDKTLMHVSRGIAGDEPIRYLCPPELGLFTIRAASGIKLPDVEAAAVKLATT